MQISKTIFAYFVQFCVEKAEQCLPIFPSYRTTLPCKTKPDQIIIIISIFVMSHKVVTSEAWRQNGQNSTV